MMIEVTIDSVRVSLMSQHRIVVLKETDSPRFLPIWIGPFEADAITIELQGVDVQRPLTHDLLKSIIEKLGAEVAQIAITDLRNDTFYAQITLQVNGRRLEIDSRPSDAIALALRMGAPIFAAPEVLKEAGYVRPDEPEPADVAPAAAAAVVQNREPAPRKAAGVQEKTILSQQQTDAGQAQDSHSVDRLELLRRRLSQAVAEEVYEEAARLRDEISRLEEESDPC